MRNAAETGIAYPMPTIDSLNPPAPETRQTAPKAPNEVEYDPMAVASPVPSIPVQPSSKKANPKRPDRFHSVPITSGEKTDPPPGYSP